MAQTQHARIIAKLKQDGEITSVWAVQNFILRLSERIRELEEMGWKFEKSFVKMAGQNTKTYRYTLADRPKVPAYELVIENGVRSVKMTMV